MGSGKYGEWKENAANLPPIRDGRVVERCEHGILRGETCAVCSVNLAAESFKKALQRTDVVERATDSTRCSHGVLIVNHCPDCDVERPADIERPATPSPATAEQPAPDETSIHPAVWDLVRSEMLERDREGQRRYGTRLRGFNGRDALVDAFQEALDLCVYLRQAIYERDHR